MVLIETAVRLQLLMMTVACVLTVPLSRTTSSASRRDSADDVEDGRYLVKFLESYYDNHLADGGARNESERDDGEEIGKKSTMATDEDYPMLSDQPAQEASPSDGNNGTIADLEYMQMIRNSYPNDEQDIWTRDKWIATLKGNILQHLGRTGNASMPPTTTTTTAKKQDVKSFNNLTNIFKIIDNNRNVTFPAYTEKIRSFYPSCTTPKTIENTWKHEKFMNLYFNVSIPNEDSVHLASAVLRLYRIPSSNETSHKTAPSTSDSSAEGVDDKLTRITIYWYARQSKKNKDIKLRICDSKVIRESTRYVEFDVKPATKSWLKSRNKNMGLAIMAEDQDSNVVRADKLIKGATCAVGTSTQKPLPTIIVDAARRANGESNRFSDILGRISTTINVDGLLYPTIDVCTIDLPKSNDKHAPNGNNITSEVCNLRRTVNEHEAGTGTRFGERERNLLASTLLDPSLVHIRHQRQHLAQKKSVGAAAAAASATTSIASPGDLRSTIVDTKVLITDDQLRQRYNLTDVNG